MNSLHRRITHLESRRSTGGGISFDFERLTDGELEWLETIISRSVDSMPLDAGVLSEREELWLQWMLARCNPTNEAYGHLDGCQCVTCTPPDADSLPQAAAAALSTNSG